MPAFQAQNPGLRGAHLGVCYRRGGKPKWKFENANLPIGGLHNSKRKAGVSGVPSVAIHITKVWIGKQIGKTSGGGTTMKVAGRAIVVGAMLCAGIGVMTLIGFS